MDKIFEHSNFRQAILFDNEEFGTGELTSKAIGNPGQAGIRLLGRFTDASGSGTASVTVKVQGADEADATSWNDLAEQSFSSTDTALEGEFFRYVPDTKWKYLRAVMPAPTGVSGKFTLEADYIPR